MSKLSRVCGIIVLALVGARVLGAPVFEDGKARAGQEEFLLKEYLDRSYSDELLSYRVSFPEGASVESLRLYDADRDRLVAFQLSETEGTVTRLSKGTVSFWLDELPAGGTRRLVLYHDPGAGFAAAEFPALGVSHTDLEQAVVEVENGALGLRLWGGSETYDSPRAAGELPGILQGYRGVDGVWRGSGAMPAEVKVMSHSLTVSEEGPLWRTYREALTFAGGGTYEMRIRVFPGRDFCEVSEYGQNGLGWDREVRQNMQILNLGDLLPDRHLEYGVFARSIRSRPVIAHATYATVVGKRAGSCWSGGGWGGMYSTDVGKNDVVGVVPVRTGRWRGGYVTFGSDPVMKQEMQLNMSVGERHWLLVLTSKAKAVLTPEQVQATTKPSYLIWWGGKTGWAPRITPESCYLWALRNKWCDFPLNKVKDWVLDYDANTEEHPRMFFGPEAKQRFETDPKYESFRVSLMDTQALEWLRTGQVKDLFRFNNPQGIRSDWDLGDATNTVKEQMALGYPSSVYVLTTGQHMRVALLYADVLWGALPPEERERWTHYALALGYILRDEDNWYSDYAPGKLAAFGNFNSCRWSGLGLAGVFFAGHPAAEEWRKFAQSEMDEEVATTVSPDGVYLENLSNYYPFWWQNTMLLTTALQRNGYADYTKESQRQKAARFLIEILTPPDATFHGNRMIPPIGHHPGAGYRYFGHFAWNQALYEKSDPQLSRWSQWAWLQNGQATAYHNRLPLNLFLSDPAAPAEAPVLTSQAWDDYGFVFRNHWETGKETYFLLKNGRVEWHHEADEGSFHMFAKGVLLAGDGLNLYSRDPACTFCDPEKTDAADRISQRTARHHNLITFRGPTNDGAVRGKWQAFQSLETVDYGHARVPRVSTGAQAGGMENSYDRLCLLMKAKDPAGPEYFVIQETTVGPHCPEWNLDVHSPLPTLNPQGKAGYVSFPGFPDPGLGVAMEVIFVAPTDLDMWVEEGMVEKAYTGVWGVKGHSLLHAAPKSWPGGVERTVDKPHEAPIYSMGFSADSKYLVTGGGAPTGRTGR